MKILAIEESQHPYEHFYIFGFFINPKFSWVLDYSGRIRKQGFYFDIWTKTLLLEVY